MSILDELNWRGLVADCTDTAELTKNWLHRRRFMLASIPRQTALHVGNLVPLLALRRFQLLGHHPIALAGGATGSIGDPSGKTAERQLLTKEVLDGNIASVKVQLAKLLDFDAKQNPARLVDNSTGLRPSASSISSATSENIFPSTRWSPGIRARPHGRSRGRHQLHRVQLHAAPAFDFYHLAKETNCELQIGGSDQWGNITAGIELTRKKLGKHVFGLTPRSSPMRTAQSSAKSVSGAIWLDPKRTSVYKFYQFWINTDDRDVIRYLKYFTFLTREEIEALEKQHAENPGARIAHKALAKATTDLIHGANATAEAIRASEILFGGNLDGISESTFNDIVGEVPTKEIEKPNSMAQAFRSWNCSFTPACRNQKVRREKISKAVA